LFTYRKIGLINIKNNKLNSKKYLTFKSEAYRINFNLLNKGAIKGHMIIKKKHDNLRELYKKGYAQVPINKQSLFSLMM